MKVRKRGRGPTLLRATVLRDATVRRSVFRIGAAEGLEYDHQYHVVTRLKMRMVDAAEAVSVPFAHLDLRHAECREVLIRGWPHVPLQPVQGIPVDRLTIKGDTEDGAPLFVHDVTFDGLTGKMVSYEVGLLPKDASSTAVVSVPAEAFTLRDGQLALPTPMIEKLRLSCAARMGLLG